MFAVRSDLFNCPALAGLAQAEAFVTETEEQALIASIDSVVLSPFRFQGWLGKRLTASFGWRYDFDDASFGPTGSILEWLLPLRQRAAQFAHLSPDELVQALLIRYDPGAGIGWHRDRPVFEHVIGVSLGAPATMRFRRRKPGGFDRASAALSPRSIYHIKTDTIGGTLAATTRFNCLQGAKAGDSKWQVIPILIPAWAMGEKPTNTFRSTVQCRGRASHDQSGHSNIRQSEPAQSGFARAGAARRFCPP